MSHKMSTSLSTQSAHGLNAKIKCARWWRLNNVLAMHMDYQLLATGSWGDKSNEVSILRAITDNKTGDTRLESLANASHSGDVNDVQFINQEWIISGSSTGEVNVYQLDASAETLTWKSGVNMHQGPVTCLATQPVADPLIASGGQDGTLKLFWLSNMEDGANLAQATSSSLISSVTFANPHTLYVSGLRSISTFDVRDADRKVRSLVHESVLSSSLVNGALTSFAVHPVMEYLVASGSSEGMITLWDVRKTSAPVSTLQVHDSIVWDMVFLPGEQNWLLSCDNRGKLLFTNLENSDVTVPLSDEPAPLEQHMVFSAPCAINSLDYDAATRTLITASDSEFLYVFKRV